MNNTKVFEILFAILAPLLVTFVLFILTDYDSRLNELRKELNILNGIHIEQGDLNADGTLNNKKMKP